MNTAPPGQTRDKRATERDGRRELLHGGYGQLVQSQQEQRAQVNYSVLEIEEGPRPKDKAATQSKRAEARGLEPREQ